MQFTATTPLACVLCLLILWLGPARGLIIVFASLPLGSAAALNLAGLGSVFVAELAMLMLCATAVLGARGSRDVLALCHPHHAGMPLLCLVMVMGTGAIFLPRLNAGLTEVYTLVREGHGATLALRPLHPTGTNIGQFFRFLLASFGFLAAAMTMMRFDAMRYVKLTFLVATCVHILLALLDLLSPVWGMSPLGGLRNAYVAILDDQTLLGVRRLIAGFPEPSAFAIYTIGLYGFWLRIWFDTPRSKLALIMVLILIALLLRSTSTAAYFGLGLYTALFFLWQLRPGRRGGPKPIFFAVMIALLPLIISCSVLAYHLVPVLSDFLDTIVFEKLTSASGSERLAWNLQALRNFAETFGTGTGIGSLRASGWPFAVLGSVGALGALLYVWFLAKTLNPVAKDGPIVGAFQSGCAAVLLLSLTILPQPNLGLSFFLMAGVVAGVRLRQVTGTGPVTAYRGAPLVHRQVG